MDRDGLAEEIRAAICDNITLCLERQGEEDEEDLHYRVHWVLNRAREAWMSEEAQIEEEAAAGDQLTVAVVKFIMTVSRSTHHTEFYGSETGEMICFGIVPFVMLRGEDKKLFDKNYVVSIRADIEGRDVDKRTGIACNLLKEIAMKYKRR